MKIVYSDHARKRMKQRGSTELEIEHVLEHPFYIKKSFEGKKEAFGEIRGRQIKIKFVEIEEEKEKFIRIVTII